jgi:hypothetical protein
MPSLSNARRARVFALLALVSLVVSSCASGEEWSGRPPAADYAMFEASVYPVLLRDCAFSECHGHELRFFHVFGPGRARIDPMLEPADPATAEEIRATYQRAVSMLASDRDIARSLLLTKPLESRAGGQGHKGTDVLGRNVYASADDPSYQLLRAWALSAARAGEVAP